MAENWTRPRGGSGGARPLAENTKQPAPVCTPARLAELLNILDGWEARNRRELERQCAEAREHEQ